jgi:choice-of-anchor B domain-containing protein
MKVLWLFCSLFLWLVSAQTTSAHSEHDKPRFVAADGKDSGNCADRFRPCASVAYAAHQSNKGDRILLAGGSYQVASADELFYLTSGIVRIEGGFNRTNYYNVRQPDENPTTLVGVPGEFRELLARQGFRVIADQKGLTDSQLTSAKLQLAGFDHSQKSQAASDCVGGQADGFTCSGVDLLAHIALGDFSSSPSAGADVWGFIDLNTAREYAIIGLQNGTAVVDVTETGSEFEVGTISGADTTWRDIKVYQSFDSIVGRWQAFAYVTADSASDRLTVIDLRGLPNSIALSGRVTPDISAHNVTIANTNYATGSLMDANINVLLQIGGSNLDGGAFRSFGLFDPQAPVLNVQSSFGGYMHDGVAFILDDNRAAASCGGSANCEILVDFNEGEFEISRISGGTATLLSTTNFGQACNVHSGWLSEDLGFLFVLDVLDERNLGLNTTLRVYDLANLGSPNLAGTWTGPTQAIDHNGYTRGNRYYMSNYTRGLTVLDITNPASPATVGFLDTFPSSDNNSFNGAWGVYPFLPSGKILVSDINSGLYVLQDSTLGLGDGSLGFSSSNFGGAEGDQIQVSVNRQGGSAAVSVGYRIIGGSADANGVDFNAVEQGRFSWAAGETGLQARDIDLLSDGVGEPVQRFFVELYDPQGGATLTAPAFAQVFVADQNAGPAEVGFSADTLTIGEDRARAVVTVQRQQNVVGSLQVDYQTTAGSALAGSDYVAANGSLQWADGDASPRTIVVALNDDSANESNETFSIDLSIVQGNAVLATSNSAVITVTDNDAAPSPPPAGGGGGGGALSWLLCLFWFVRLRRR